MRTPKTSDGLTCLYQCGFLLQTIILVPSKWISTKDCIFVFVFDTCRSRGDRPEEWVPEEIDTSKDDNDNDVHDVYSDAAQDAVESGSRNIVDIFSIHSANNDTGTKYD